MNRTQPYVIREHSERLLFCPKQTIASGAPQKQVLELAVEHRMLALGEGCPMASLAILKTMSQQEVQVSTGALSSLGIDGNRLPAVC